MSVKQVGRYLIVKELGRGGMSTVFLGRGPIMDRQVAIKLLPREFLHHEEFRARFNREAPPLTSPADPPIR